MHDRQSRVLAYAGPKRILNTLPAYYITFGALNHPGKIEFTATLFLIGTGRNKQTLQEVDLGCV